MRKKTALAFAIALLLQNPTATAKIKHLLPRPQQITATESDAPFSLQREVCISDPTGCAALVRFFTENGCTVSNDTQAKVTVTITDAIDGAYDYKLEGFPNEAYTLNITANAINITAVSQTGVVRAAQTLTQLAEGYEGTPALEALTMKDWPAFKLRGFMHDVGRSFIDFTELKHQIDLLARFKVNVFHFHLTENQAWRFEVKAYPKLTEASSMTRFAGSYYTQEQCKELEEYAAERGIIIIPEIDMPGHSDAFARAMGYDMQTQQGVTALQKILEEVAATFTKAPYIHIGADEKAITYPNFLQTMTGKLHELGKKVVVWNPISGVSITSAIGADMTQMWSTAGKKIAGMPNIDCRYNYTNHFDVFADLVGIYKSNIYYQQQGSEDVAGFISAPWNDRKTPTQDDIIRQNNVYATVLASTERGWIGGGKQYIEVGGTTLPNSGEEFEEFANWEERFLFHKANSLKDEPIPYVKQTNVRWRITDPMPNGGNAALTLPPETEGLCDSYNYNGTNYGTNLATGAGIYLRHTWGATIPTFYGTTPQLNNTAYAWTYVYSPEEQTVGALIEFQNYGRSEKDTAPEKGCWDRKGSKIWVNDEEVLPPVWDNTGVAINNEVDLKNENLTARKPTLVNLKKGWNKVFLKLPYVSASGVRLNKWMFTFVLTDTEGRNAVEDLIYSPDQCLDAEAEAISALISDIRKYRNALIGSEPGYYSETLAAELDAAVEEVEATLSDEMDSEARNAQRKKLNEVFESFKSAISNAEVNMPIAGQGYYLCTPLRDGRYPTAKGAGNDIVGEAAKGEAAVWKFMPRNDGAYNIISQHDETYISPNSTYNTALRTVSEEPTQGWTLKPAQEMGFFIIVSGEVEMNQTTSGLGYKLYNWGSGTNTNDAGCQFRITTAESLPPAEELPEPVLTLTDLQFDGTGPYRVPDNLTAPVFATSNCTAVIDYTLTEPGTISVLTGSSDTTASNNFFSIVTRGSNNYMVRYVGDTGTEDGYSQNATVSGRHQIAIAMHPEAPEFVFYLDGSHSRDVSGVGSFGYRTFGNVPNVDALYVGGLVTASNNNLYPFVGTVHSIRYYDQALSSDQVARLTYDNLTPTGISAAASTPLQTFSIVNGRIISAQPFTIYTPDGRSLPSDTRLQSGVYVVRQAGQSAKVLVR